MAIELGRVCEPGQKEEPKPKSGPFLDLLCLLPPADFVALSKSKLNMVDSTLGEMALP